VRTAKVTPPRSATGVVLKEKLISLNVRKFVVPVLIKLSGSESSTPTIPATSPRRAASIRKAPMMLRLLKPSTLSAAISCVRADTAAYIVFAAAKQAPTAMTTARMFASTKNCLVVSAVCCE
jgi:hypothetical protein